MKTYIYSILFFALFIAFFSCKDDPITDGEGEYKEVNEWIYSKMSENYLWYKEMPGSSNSNKYDPKTFFYSLLSNKDGKSTYYYSYIEESNATKASMGDGVSFGFEYIAWDIQEELENGQMKHVRYGIQVLYVLPNSPAEEKGMKRGDWIFYLNDKKTDLDFYDILSGTASVTFGIAEHMNQEENYTTVTLTPRKVEDNPIYKTDVLLNGKVGYLAYNHFTTGPGGSSDHTYDKQLIEEITSLAGQNISDFILDLRYNGGGYVSSAQILSSYLLPQSKEGEIFCKMTYNDKQKTQEIEHRFTKYGNLSNPNLQLNRLFVIISPRSASASELVIAALKPYINEIILMGDTSEGKNVGSVQYEDDKYDWILHPIVCYVTNKDGWDYSKGIDPTEGFTYTLKDDNKLDNLYDLGDPEEEMLKRLLTFIETGVKPDDQEKEEEEIEEVAVKSVSYKKSFTPLQSSLDRKKTNGVLLN